MKFGEFFSCWCACFGKAPKPRTGDLYLKTDTILALLAQQAITEYLNHPILAEAIVAALPQGELCLPASLKEPLTINADETEIFSVKTHTNLIIKNVSRPEQCAISISSPGSMKNWSDQTEEDVEQNSIINFSTNNQHQLSIRILANQQTPTKNSQRTDLYKSTDSTFYRSLEISKPKKVTYSKDYEEKINRLQNNDSRRKYILANVEAITRDFVIQSNFYIIETKNSSPIEYPIFILMMHAAQKFRTQMHFKLSSDELPSFSEEDLAYLKLDNTLNELLKEIIQIHPEKLFELLSNQEGLSKKITAISEKLGNALREKINALSDQTKDEILQEIKNKLKEIPSRPSPEQGPLSEAYSYQAMT